jgi:hypothetical protein
VALALFTKLQSAAVTLKPDSHAIPGIPTGEKLVDGIAAAVIVALLGGILIGLAQYGLSSHSSNAAGASAGKRRVGICIAGIFGVGAAAAIVNWALQAGGTVK